ncbi:hypothetical protein ACFCX8_40560, partial [Streptomyces chartreusis]
MIGRDAERGVVEEVENRRIGEAGVALGQVGVRAELVLRVLGLRAEGLVEQDLGEGGVAVLARRQDVGALVPAVVVRGGGLVDAVRVDGGAAGAVDGAAFAGGGLGVGWFEEEHKAYGIPFPKEKFARLEEQLAIVTG